MQKRYTFGTMILLTACGGTATLERFDQPQPNAISIDFDNAEVVEPKVSEGGVVTASIDPNSNVTQLIQASSDSAIADTSVAFPPGALAIAADITIQPGSESLTESLEAELSLSEGNSVVSGGTPVQIDASQIQDLNQPFVLAVGVPSSPGLVEADNTDRLAIMYQVKKENGTRLEAGMVPRSELTIEGDKVLFSSKYFGWFRAVYLAKVETKTIVADSKAKAYIGLKLIQDAASLPACAATDVGITVYVASDKTFRTCTSSGWKKIDLKGEKGDAGATGSKGAPGSFIVKTGNGTKLGTLLSIWDFNEVLVRAVNGYDIAFTRRGDYLYPFPSKEISLSQDNKVKPGCFYEQPGCSGDCMIMGGYSAKMPPIDYIVPGKNAALAISTSDQSFFKANPGHMSSVWLPDLKQCYNYDNAYQNWEFNFESYTTITRLKNIPSSSLGFSFPVTGPLEIEAN